jgi:hypothetical protein
MTISNILEEARNYEYFAQETREAFDAKMAQLSPSENASSFLVTINSFIFRLNSRFAHISESIEDVQQDLLNV